MLPLANAIKSRLLSAILLAAAGTPLAANAAQVVNIYSYRQPELIAPLMDAFTRQSGIKTNILFLKKGLVDRIRAEGMNSPVDVILTTDIGRLTGAKSAGITRSVVSETINGNIPARYRDPAGHWFGVTIRARVIFASKQRVAQNDITYEELADAKWKGRICTRSGQHIYNIGLFASMIAHHGKAYTAGWLTGVKNNLARKPQGNDRGQAKAIYSGECDIGLGNNYYVGKMQTNEERPEQKAWTASIKVLFSQCERSRDPCEHIRHCHGKTRSAPRQCAQTDGISHQYKSPGNLRCPGV